MAVLTIYNCGTAFDRNSNDVIADLGRRTAGREGVDWIINAGPGSPGASAAPMAPAAGVLLGGLGLIPSVRDNVSRYLDQATGVGMYPMLAASLRVIRQTSPTRVNFCGWSRGSVASILTANVMAAAFPTIRCNMFLFDPVLGDPVLNPLTHAFAAPELNGIGANVDDLWVIQQLDATDFIFQAHAPFAPDRNHARSTKLLPMPGQHGSAVYRGEERYAPLYRIGSGLAVTLLAGWGTQVAGYRPIDPRSWFDDYARLWLNVAGIAGYRSAASDALLNNRSSAVAPDSLVMRCFFNQHHIDLAVRYVPKITLALLYVLTSRTRPPANLIADAEAELALNTAPPTTHQYLSRAMMWLRMYN